MTIDGQIKILEAARDGKKIEVKRATCGEFTLNAGTTFDFINYEYRIVEPKKKRLIRVEELPPVCWIKGAKNSLPANLVTVRSDYWFVAGETTIELTGDEDVKDLVWSSDLKTWNEFTMEE